MKESFKKVFEESKRSYLEIIKIIFFFILATYLVQHYNIYISGMINEGFLGMVLYLTIIILAIVIAPVSMVPLIPLASNIWGWKISGILNVLGWTLGSLIAFYLARKYGAPLVSKLVSVKKIHQIESLVPNKNLFWTIVFLRMSIPVDILSYALGLFSKMNLRSYTLATLIGITPFAFVFAYLGMVSFYYQLAAILIATFIFLCGVIVVLKNKKS